jgi:large subunit ribosomal protein L3
MSHGSGYHRGHGSNAIIRTANRVPKGKNLPGHMGHETVTIQNLEVIKVDAERNVILVKGSIPGPRNSYVSVKSAIKK